MLTERLKGQLRCFSPLGPALPVECTPGQPARQDVSHLILGLGGDGCEALLEAKALICRHCGTDGQLPENVKCLFLDTDQATAEMRSSPESGGVEIDVGREFVFLPLRPASVHARWEYLREWLREPPGGFVPSDHGAGSIRQVGRVALFCNVDMLVERLRHAISSVLVGRLVGQQKLYIHILSGLGGGTGSGMVLDLAYIVRTTAENFVPGLTVKNIGYLFLPDVDAIRDPVGVRRGDLYGNAFAAIKELDYHQQLQRNGGVFQQRYSGNFCLQTDMAPFDLPFLIGAGIVGTPNRQRIMCAAAQRILQLVADEAFPAAAAHNHVHVLEHLLHSRTQYRPERQNAWLTLNAAAWGVPPQEELRLAMCAWMDKVSGELNVYPDPVWSERLLELLGLPARTLWPELMQGVEEFHPEEPCWQEVFGGGDPGLRGETQAWLQNNIRRVRRNAEQLRAARKNAIGSLHQRNMLWGRQPNNPILLCRLWGDAGETGLRSLLHGQLRQVELRQNDLRMQCDHWERDAAHLEQDGMRTNIFRKTAITREYVDALRQWNRCRLETEALYIMNDILHECMEELRREVEENYRPAAEVLDELCGLCANAPVPQQLQGGLYIGGPSLPVLHTTMKNELDAAITDERAAQELSDVVLQWVEGAFDPRHTEAALCTALCGLLRRYLPNGGPRPMDALVAGMLGVPALPASVVTGVLNAAAPLQRAGGEQWLLSVPSDSPQALAAAQTVAAARPGIEVQPLCVPGCILATGVAVGAATEFQQLHECELLYYHTDAAQPERHLRPEWKDLPDPIPQHARRFDDPPALAEREESLRQLFRRCREQGIIRREAGQYGRMEYRLYEAPEPQAALAAAEELLRMSGEPDAERRQAVSAELRQWLELWPVMMGGEYLPLLDFASPAGPEEEQQQELLAAEYMTGQYDNAHAARRMLERCGNVAAKLGALERMLRETERQEPAR